MADQFFSLSQALPFLPCAPASPPPLSYMGGPTRSAAVWQSRGPRTMGLGRWQVSITVGFAPTTHVNSSTCTTILPITMPRSALTLSPPTRKSSITTLHDPPRQKSSQLNRKPPLAKVTDSISPRTEQWLSRPLATLDGRFDLGWTTYAFAWKRWGGGSPMEGGTTGSEVAFPRTEFGARKVDPRPFCSPSTPPRCLQRPTPHRQGGPCQQVKQPCQGRSHTNGPRCCPFGPPLPAPAHSRHCCQGTHNHQSSAPSRGAFVSTLTSAR